MRFPGLNALVCRVSHAHFPTARFTFSCKDLVDSAKKQYLCAVKITLTRPLSISCNQVGNSGTQKKIIMKKGLHPENYRPVVFKDMSNGDMFLSRSTCKTTDTVEFEGETYPVVKLEISSTSHPFYTGKSKLVDTAGRVDKFMSRYGNRSKK